MDMNRLANLADRIERKDRSVEVEINGLNHAERRQIRAMLPEDCPQPRNLWFDYTKQEWID